MAGKRCVGGRKADTIRGWHGSGWKKLPLWRPPFIFMMYLTFGFNKGAASMRLAMSSWDDFLKSGGHVKSRCPTPAPKQLSPPLDEASHHFSSARETVRK